MIKRNHIYNVKIKYDVTNTVFTTLVCKMAQNNTNKYRLVFALAKDPADISH